MLQAPAPLLEERAFNRPGDLLDKDQTVNFATMKIVLGRCFDLKAEQPGEIPDRNSAPVSKAWLVSQETGTSFLIESLPYPEILDFLQRLPEPAARQIDRPKVNQRLAARTGSKRALPVSLASSVARTPKARRPLRLAARNSLKPAPGVVLDYLLINSTQTNFTFKGDTTYYATNYVALNGKTTLEGGTVVKGIKWDNGPYTGTFIVYGSFECRTGPYRPAIFTGADDDTVGEIISGSTGIPSPPYRASLWFSTTNSIVLENVRTRYAVVGCSISPGASATLRHLQFGGCTRRSRNSRIVALCKTF
jgi:hypothetical protein